MSFKIHSIDDNRISGIEYLPCGAITPKVGMALVQSGGNLALATGTNAPTYISMFVLLSFGMLLCHGQLRGCPNPAQPAASGGRAIPG